jgi:hypothetical protein
MAWESDMNAGFALAALLADDRELAHVEEALGPALRAQLASPAQGSLAPGPARLDSSLAPGPARLDSSLARGPARFDSERDVRALLRVLYPDLDGGAALSLPPRMRALVARLVPTAQRRVLREERLESRADFDLDDELLRLLLRIARRGAGLEPQ